MVSKALIIIFVLNYYRETSAESWLSPEKFDQFSRQYSANAPKNDEIQNFVNQIRAQIISDVKSELAALSSEIKRAMVKYLEVTSDFLKNETIRAIRPVKQQLEIAEGQLSNLQTVVQENSKLENTLKSTIQEELKAFQRTELDSLVIQVKSEIIESVKANSEALKAQITSVADSVENQTAFEQKSKGVVKGLEEICKVSSIIQSELESLSARDQKVNQKLQKLEDNIKNLSQSLNQSLTPSPRSSKPVVTLSPKDFKDSMEKLETLITSLKPNTSETSETSEISMLESIKSTVETMNEEQDAKSDELISKLEGKIGKLLTSKLKSRTSCTLSAASKASLAAIKTGVEFLTAKAEAQEENSFEEKLEALLTELDANTTSKFDKVNIKLDGLKKTAEGLDSSFKGIGSTIQGALTTEFSKFEGTQGEKIKTAVGDAFVKIPKGGKEEGKVKEIKTLIQGSQEKLIGELEKSSAKIIKAVDDKVCEGSNQVVNAKGNSDKAPKKNANVAPEKNSEENTEENSDKGLKENAEGNSNKPPKENAEENSNEAPKENANVAPEENSDKAPKENAEENSDKAPKKNANVASEENSEENAEENSDKAPKENAEGNSNEPPKENTHEAPNENTEENSDKTSKENAEKNSDEASEENA